MTIPAQTPKPEPSLDERIWGRQYAQTEGETFQEGAIRVGNGVAKTPEDAKAYSRMILDKTFIPGGRILAGAGSTHGNLLNCFVQDGNPYDDGSTEGVLHLAQKLALVTKVGGGNGVNLDRLSAKRPYPGKIGEAYLTITNNHPDYQRVKDGTYMNLVHGQYETKPYERLVFMEPDQPIATDVTLRVTDDVEGIWDAAGKMVQALLNGESVLVDLSELRAEGSLVAGSGGSSSGPSSFAVEIFENFARWARLGGAEHAGPVATLRYVYAPTLRAIRQGGCLTPETLVHTAEGTYRLSELAGEVPLADKQLGLLVPTDEGHRIAVSAWNNDVANTLEVTISNGQAIRGTPNHKLKVQLVDGRREWKRLDELREGDWVIQAMGQHRGAAVPLKPVPTQHHNSKPITTPKELDAELAYVLGLLWGDGFVSKDGTHRVGFAVADDSPVGPHLIEYFEQTFGLAFDVSRRPNNNSYILATKSAALVGWLQENGLEKSYAADIDVPLAIRRSQHVGAFLGGLFEADGTIAEGKPRLNTISERLARDVQVMLAGLGVPSAIRTDTGDRWGDVPVWIVRVLSKKGLERYVEQVPVLHGSRFDALNASACDERKESSWPIPHAPALMKSLLAETVVGVKGRPSVDTPFRKTLLRYHRGERQLNAYGAERLGVPGSWFEEHYWKVLSIREAGPTLTLDLTVEGNHTYLANGFITHNTRRGAGMATLSATHDDLLDFITAKDLERERDEGDIGTFNISVLASDAFMRAATQAGTREAKNLDAIADHAWQTGEPGIIFVDAINLHNPLAEIDGPIMATNPCVTGDTEILTTEGPKVFRDLAAAGRDVTVWAVNPLTRDMNVRVMRNPRKTRSQTPILKVTFDSGLQVRCTPDHNLFTVEGEKVQAQELKPGDSVLAYGGAPTTHYVPIPTGPQGHATAVNHKVIRVEDAGVEDVYNGTVDELHTYLIPDRLEDGLYAGGIVGANCGEIPLYPAEPCDLGAINLGAFVRTDDDGKAYYDSLGLQETARLAVRFLDDVLDAEVSPLQEIHDAIADKRRIGLGLMGLADMLIKLGIRYDSQEGRDMVQQVVSDLRDAALDESHKLGQERGIPEGVKRAGLKRRNIAVFTVAPTGTTSMLAGVSGGVEPMYAATFVRKIGTDYVTVVQPLLDEILNALDAERFVKDGGSDRFVAGGEWDRDKISAALNEHKGSILPLLKDLPSDPRLQAFVTAHDIAAEDHVLMQAAIQRAYDWLNDDDWREGNKNGMTLAGNSLSKTINMANEARVEDVHKAYRLAWEQGCKGITVYRDGSRDFQVLTTGTSEEKPQEDAPTQREAPAPVSPAPAPTQPAPAARSAYDRPSRMRGFTDQVKLIKPNGEKQGFFITVNSNGNNDPREVFVNSGKGGEEVNADSEALGRVVSIALQWGVPPEALIKTLRGINGGMYGNYNGRIVSSRADLIAVALESAVEDTQSATPPASTTAPRNGVACPQCGGPTIRVEGCSTCTDPACGHAACG